MDVWPALPLIIMCDYSYPNESPDNVIAGLERSDRVDQIILINARTWRTRSLSSDLEMLFSAMQRPFPKLRHVMLSLHGEPVAAVPDSFLGGSAPRLEYLELIFIPFPALPKLLFSATHLVVLCLEDIPHSGYFQPDEMVTALSTLTSLKRLTLKFQFPRSCPDLESRRPPPSTRSVLPVLTFFSFKGVTEYLEDLVACINTPQLNALDIIFFNDFIFNAPHLIKFTGRTPALRTLKKAHIHFGEDAASIDLSSQTFGYDSYELKLMILCRGLDWQVSSLNQACTSCLHLLSMMEDLYIYYRPSYPREDWTYNIENGLWLEILHQFTGVKNLYLSKKVASHTAPALQELIEGRTTEVLPALQNIFLEGFESSGVREEGIGLFVAARQVASHPIAVSRWANSKENKVRLYRD